jgi:hypothetical protein
VTKFVGQDGSEDNPYQGQTSPFVGAMGSVLGVPDEERQQEKSPMNAKFNSENAACRYGPASHEKPAVFCALTILYSLDST